MDQATPLSRSTIAQGRLFGTDTRNGRRLPGYEGPADVWPDRKRLLTVARYDAHPWPWLLANDDLYNQEVRLARTLLADKVDVDDDGRVRIKPGKLTEYSRHRAAEWLTAQYVHHIVAPYCREELPHLEGRMLELARKMFFCRQCGPFGVAGGKLVVAWEDKCGHKKLCPDEARQESQRLEERLAPVIAEHGRRGGRVYKAVFTLPNYPTGRLREGMRHIVKRFRDRLIRSKRFGVEGAIVIVEAPLSARGDWNVHLNAVLLTRRWLSYRELREVWGAGLEIRQVSDFSERGMHKLFAEAVKYAVRSVAEKSLDERHRDTAPPMIEWSPELFLEWYQAHHPFRRTRTYKSLFRVPEPERETPQPTEWIGRLDYQGGAYRITWRSTNALELMKELLERGGMATLDWIRGHKSTVRSLQNGMRGPP